MTNTIAGVHLGPDTHANRPAATAVTAGTLYSCSDHDLIYRSDGSTWATWADVGDGAAGAVTLITDTLLGVAAASFDFTSIPGTYKHLRIEVTGRSAVAATNDNVTMRLNNDSGNNYDSLHWAFGTGSAFPGALTEALAASSMRALAIPGGSSTAGDSGSATIVIPNYAATTLNKTAHAEGGTLFARSAQQIRIQQMFGSWRSTAAITRVTLAPAGGNWLAGSRATLYGVT